MVSAVKVVTFESTEVAYTEWDGVIMPKGAIVSPLKLLANVIFNITWDITRKVKIVASQPLTGEIAVTLWYSEGGYPLQRESVKTEVKRQKHEDIINLRPTVKKVKKVEPEKPKMEEEKDVPVSEDKKPVDSVPQRSVHEGADGK